MTCQKAQRSLFENPGWLLALGAALVVAANMRFGIGLLAWVASVPLLRYLRVTQGWRSRVVFGSALVLAWVAATLKIVTEPLPLAFALLGMAFGALWVGGFLVADFFRRRLGEGAGLVGFPAVMIALEWLQHRYTNLASWGAAGYTQLDDLPFLQLASVTGIAGIGFLVYFAGAALESMLSDGSRAGKRAVALASCLVVAAHVFGALRLARPTHGSVTAAAIGTDATFNGTTTPSAQERARTLDRLFADTHAAARAGAKLAVWTEAAALVMPAEEPALVARLRRAAASDQIQIVAAYIVLKSTTPLSFENKYSWVRSDGVLDHSYLKHKPVPGEPAVVGKGPLLAVETELGRAGGALCYDYDFPALAAEHGRLGVDLVALPSSDWRGIDPLHTQMASLRAIEQGVSIVRSTRLGLSAGIDPMGRMLAQRSSFASDARVLLVELPRHGVSTLYRRYGDVLVYVSIALLLALAGWAALRTLALRAPCGLRASLSGSWLTDEAAQHDIRSLAASLSAGTDCGRRSRGSA